jgi:hypothetical protein
MSLRRAVLVSGVIALTALVARRAHAVRDPSELSVGGSTGAHDAHIACGPDIRVRHASGGVHYERLFQSEPGRGATIDVRAGVGSTVITSVSDTNTSDKARMLDANERGRTHMLITGQALAGWDWRTFALRGGVGYFGLSALTDEDRRFKAKYYPLPALDMRIGKRTGFRGNLGLGAPPVPGLIRWYSLYGILAYRFKEGGDISVGNITTFGGTLDQRNGFFFSGMFPITENVHVGGFALIGADEYSKLNGFNWTAGGALRLMLDAPEE